MRILGAIATSVISIYTYKYILYINDYRIVNKDTLKLEIYQQKLKLKEMFKQNLLK